MAANRRAARWLDEWGCEALRRGAYRRPPGATVGSRALERSRGPDVRARPGHDPSDWRRSPPCRERCRTALDGLRSASTLGFPRSAPTRSACLSSITSLRRGEVWVAPEALELLQEVREQHARAAGLVALSGATDVQFDVCGLGGALKPFQRAGVSYVLAQRRAFLADEQGLGKTIEALATLEADTAYPAVVVCPAASSSTGCASSSAGCRIAASGRSWAAVLLLDGGPSGLDAGAEIVVVNYDIVAARLEDCGALSPGRSCSTSRITARTLRRSEHRRFNGSQLSSRTMAWSCAHRDPGREPSGRAHLAAADSRAAGDFGSGAQFAKRFRGPDAHLRLHWHLRSRCFVRRVKADVLPQLPAKRRAIVPVELDNEPEYRLAERDLIAWLQSRAARPGRPPREGRGGAARRAART